MLLVLLLFFGLPATFMTVGYARHWKPEQWPVNFLWWFGAVMFVLFVIANH